jgi:hypothetical protein
MLQTSRCPKLSEKGLLTPDNCVVALPQMLFGGMQLRPPIYHQ